MLNCDEIKNVLVHVGLDRIGDGLLKLPFVRGLWRAFPNAQLTWFAGKETTVYAHALAHSVTNDIDEIIEFGSVGLTPKELIGKRPLTGRYFNLVIDTQRNFWTALSAKRIRHQYFISPAAKFLLSSARPNRHYKFPKSMQRQMLDLLELCTGSSFPTPNSLDLNIPEYHQQHARVLLPGSARYIGFAPGSGGRPKCWPLERYIEVAKLIETEGGTPVFFIGPQEEEWVPIITAQVPTAVLPLQIGDGPTHHGYDPLLSIALGQRLSAAVSNDSGIAHMLAVAGAPLVALYGPTVYEKFPPMTEKIYVIRAGDYGSREMSSIPITPVTNAIKGLLAKPDGA